MLASAHWLLLLVAALGSLRGVHSNYCSNFLKQDILLLSEKQLVVGECEIFPPLGPGGSSILVMDAPQVGASRILSFHVKNYPAITKRPLSVLYPLFLSLGCSQVGGFGFWNHCGRFRDVLHGCCLFPVFIFFLFPAGRSYN